MYSKADEFFIEVVAKGALPHSIAYNALINGVVRTEDIDEAADLVDTRNTQELFPDVFT